MEQVARASAGLLSAYPDEASRAAAYPRVVGMLQSQGYAKHAPAQYPGEAVLRSLVNQGVPVADQYKMGLINAPGLTDALNRSNAPLPGQPGYGGTGTGATGTAPATAPSDFKSALAQSESGGKPGVINPQGYTGLYQFGKQRLADLGYYTPAPGEDMKDNTTWAGKVSVPGFNVTDQQSFAANPAAQQVAFNTHLGNIDQAIANTPGANRFDPNGLRAVAHLGGVDGMQRFVASGGTFSPGDANGTTLASYYNKFSGGTPTATAAPGRTQVASNAPNVALPAATTEPQPPTAAAPPSTATTTAAASAPTIAPASTAQPAPSTGTGTQSPQFQAALEMNRRATALETQFPYSPQAKAQAASLRAQAALYMQADSVSVDPATGIQTKQLTGERLNAAAPNAHYVWNEQQGAYVDTTGVHPPVTPPSPRLTIAPGGDVLQSKPGGGIAVVKPADPGAIQTQEAAKTSGAAAGTATGKLTGELADQGRTAASAIGNIDYGMSQVAKAKAGGINTGYFAPWLSTVASVAKSLGVPTEAIGVDPNAVGNIQTAKKTLAVVSGAILQQILGPGSQVTDAKIQHFIAAQPGIETDPAALERVLNWARSQFVYEREMAAKGMQDASATGVLPTNWQAKYYHEHGFAPIYNPGTGEMQQPDGQAPSREPPASTANAPKAVAPPAVGTIKGGYRFKGGDPASQANWERVQ